MHIGGLQRFTLADFPGRDAAVVFTAGCNLRCPYCHNPELVCGGARVDEEAVWAFLERRRGRLDGVVLSGGEPTLQDDLLAACRRIKAMGFALKLDTNGLRPAVLAAVLAEDLADYIALDLKAPPEAYPERLGGGDPAALRRSLELVVAAGVAGECRTTVVHPLLTGEAVVAIGELVGGRLPWILQDFRPHAALDPAFAAGARAFASEERERLLRELDARGLPCRWRNAEIRSEAPPSGRHRSLAARVAAGGDTPSG